MSNLERSIPRDVVQADRPGPQDRLTAIVQHLPDGIVILNRNGSIRFANPAAEKLFGRTLDKLTGVDLGFLSIGGESSEIEVVRPGGASVTAEVRYVETQWEGEPVRLVSIRDVTDRKRAAERAEQLQRERLARAEAEASSQAKSEFLATMSHELRTPLNAVIGYAQLLDLGVNGSLNEEQQKQVLRIRHSARHLLGLVNEVLDLARVEAGRLSVQSRAARAAEAIDAAVSLVHPLAESRGIHLVAAEHNREIVFDGDEERVRQILVNLLNNAVKFTAPGGRVELRSGIEARPDPEARVAGAGPWVFMRVSDTGIGIPKDRLAAIFDPFVQVERGHTRSKDGSGLGLTISRRLARLMGGDLTVRSEAAKGSTFTLWLRQATAEQLEAARWRAEAPETAARLHGLSDVGSLLVRELNPLVEAFVARLRDEAIVPGAESLRASQLADHVAAYVSDIAGMLGAIEEARGQPSRLVADGAEIQLYIADRHGAQRARLGWTTEALHREWAILREEIERVIARGANGVPQDAAAEALIIVDRLLEQAHDHSARALERALAGQQGKASN